jgi:hypothetical protein
MRETDTIKTIAMLPEISHLPAVATFLFITIIFIEAI